MLLSINEAAAAHRRFGGSCIITPADGISGPSTSLLTNPFSPNR